MHHRYEDILERISSPPLWFDENAVPRFWQFTPKRTAYIYSREAVLALIRCQACSTEFRVAFTELNLGSALRDKSGSKVRKISDLIADGSLHYGDPPNIGCCSSGATMNSIPVRVLEYWYQPVIRGVGLKGHKITECA
jgi:hypothetical protein